MSAPAHPAQMPATSVWRQFYALTKPRVVQLIVFCALIGMVLAVPEVPTLAELLRMAEACLGIWLVAGAAAAFNCLVEKGIDARMKRTAWRPTARGELSDRQALLFSAALCALGSAILWFAVNPLTMWLTFATFVGYAVVYTVVLKPLTPQNIVIGGASGAMPPVLGWAAMTGSVDPEALILFLIIFLWTPPHYWPLSMKYKADYAAAGVPMLAVVRGRAQVGLQVILYAWATVACSLLLIPIAGMGLVYSTVAVVTGAWFIYETHRLYNLAIRHEQVSPMRVFHGSIVYLSLVFLAVGIDPLLPF